MIRKSAAVWLISILCSCCAGSAQNLDGTPQGSAPVYESSASAQSQPSFNSLLDSVRAAKTPNEAKQIAGDALTKISDGTFPQQESWNILAAVRTKHPRLLITDEDLSTISDTIKSDKTAARLNDVLIARAQEMLHSEGPHYSKHPEEALTQARLSLKRITTFAALYRLYHDKRYFNQARADMLNLAKFPDWGPANFLDVAEMTASMGIGYDWLFDQLSEEDRAIIKEAIVSKGLDPALKQYHGDGWWRTANSNWNFVCNGGLSVGALAIAESEPERASKVIACALISTPLALKSLDPDGGWSEGPMYWTYGTRYLFYFLRSLQTALNSDFGLSKSPGLSETGYFRIYTESPIGKCFNFADSETEIARGAQMFWLSREFKQPVFAGAELHISEIFPEMFHLLFYTKTHVTPGEAQLPLNKVFKGVNVACMRSSWTNPNAAFVGFKGGDNGSHHAHLDLGTFVFDVGGVRWAEDLGPDSYDLPGYFDKERWNYYRTKTEGHNTLTVDSKNQNISAKSAIIKFSANEIEPFAIADLTNAYNGAFSTYKRGIKLLGSNSLLVQDEFEAPNMIPTEWHMHTLAKLEVQPDGKSAILTQEHKGRIVKLSAEILTPSDATFTASSVKFSPPENKQVGVTDLKIARELTKRKSKIAVRLSLRSLGASQIMPERRNKSAQAQLDTW
ncbi:MAG TPA: heparinase II/III family protein [Drouetiella sp.]